jgi:hypothetical protein
VEIEVTGECSISRKAKGKSKKARLATPFVAALSCKSISGSLLRFRAQARGDNRLPDKFRNRFGTQRFLYPDRLEFFVQDNQDGTLSQLTESNSDYIEMAGSVSPRGW